MIPRPQVLGFVRPIEKMTSVYAHECQPFAGTMCQRFIGRSRRHSVRIAALLARRGSIPRLLPPIAIVNAPIWLLVEVVSDAYSRLCDEEDG
jgi:hypothetical protein